MSFIFLLHTQFGIVLQTPYLGPLKEGSTACVTIVTDNEIFVGNIGDTRCVLSMRGQGQVGEVYDHFLVKLGVGHPNLS